MLRTTPSEIGVPPLEYVNDEFMEGKHPNIVTSIETDTVALESRYKSFISVLHTTDPDIGIPPENNVIASIEVPGFSALAPRYQQVIRKKINKSMKPILKTAASEVEAYTYYPRIAGIRSVVKVCVTTIILTAGTFAVHKMYENNIDFLKAKIYKTLSESTMRQRKNSSVEPMEAEELIAIRDAEIEFQMNINTNAWNDFLREKTDSLVPDQATNTGSGERDVLRAGGITADNLTQVVANIDRAVVVSPLTVCSLHKEPTEESLVKLNPALAKDVLSMKPEERPSYLFQPGEIVILRRELSSGMRQHSGGCLPSLPATPEVISAFERMGVPQSSLLHFHINSWGLHGPEPDPKAEIRELFLGDSGIFGVGLEEHQSIPALRGEQIAKSLKKNPSDISIVNAGLPGQGPKDYLANAKLFVDRFRPQNVIIGWFVSNDAGDVHNSRYASLSQQHMSELIEFLKTKQVDHRILIIPQQENFRGEYSDYEHELVRICGNRTTVINPMQALLQKAEELGGYEKLFLPKDNHLNHIGNEVMAQELMKRSTIKQRDR